MAEDPKQAQSHSGPPRREGGGGHGQRAEDFPAAENVQGLLGEAFKSDAKNDESDVAVFGARAGVGGKRHGGNCSEKIVARVSLQK